MGVGELSEAQRHVIYRTWSEGKRFYPEELRSDEDSYFIETWTKYEEVREAFFSGIGIEDLLGILGANSSAERISRREILDKYERSGLGSVETANEYEMLNLVLQTPFPFAPQSEKHYEGYLEMEDGSECRLTKSIKLLVGELLPDYEADGALVNNMSEAYMGDSDLLVLGKLLENFRSSASLLDLTELLYRTIHMDPFSPRSGMAMGLSTKSMMLFNSGLEYIGLNRVPILGVDFAAYALDLHGFTAYMLYLTLNLYQGSEIDVEQYAGILPDPYRNIPLQPKITLDPEKALG
jgi:hypothetical protein